MLINFQVPGSSPAAATILITSKTRNGSTPATNAEIADDLCLSIEGVRTHMRALFAAFELDGLARNHKRVELTRRALALGLVRVRDVA